MKRLIPLLLICSAVTAFFVAGCTLHQGYPKPVEMNLPDAYESDGWVHTADPFPGDPWWAVFNDDILSDLMKKTFAGNLDLARYAARRQQVLATTRQSNTDGLPYVNFAGSGRRSQQVSAAGENVGTSLGYSLAAGWMNCRMFPMLFPWGCRQNCCCSGRISGPPC